MHYLIKLLKPYYYFELGFKKKIVKNNQVKQEFSYQKNEKCISNKTYLAT
jgi:hypothetical protein